MNGHRSPRLTGRHVLIIAIAAFGTIIAANLTMLFAATGSFPGLVVENSYIASQRWNARSTAQQALGWHVDTAWRDGWLRVDLRGADGRPVQGAAVEATVGRPSIAAEDRTLALTFANGAYTAPVLLAPGAWRVEIRTLAGPAFTVTDRLHVLEGG